MHLPDAVRLIPRTGEQAGEGVVVVPWRAIEVADATVVGLVKPGHDRCPRGDATRHGGIRTIEHR